MEAIVGDSFESVVRDRPAAHVNGGVVVALNRAVLGVVCPDDPHTST